jgi:hypothetical protein
VSDAARPLDRQAVALSIAAIAAFAVLRIPALMRYPMWTDETWTMALSATDFRRALRMAADDQTHPPLFYVLLWAWRRVFGLSQFAARALPGLFGIATGAGVVALARRAGFTSRATVFAAALCAGSGFLVAYSAELRDYALLGCFAPVALALWLRARDADEPRGTMRALTIVNVALVYSHYFGVFVVAAEWIEAAGWARRRLGEMTRSAIVTAVALVPWVAYTVHRAGITGRRLEVVAWLSRPTASDVLDLPRLAVAGPSVRGLDYVVVATCMAMVGVWLWRRRGARHADGVRVLGLSIALPVVVAFVGSHIARQSMWLDRYFIATIPAMLLLAAAALDALLPRRLTAAGFAMCLVPGAFTVASLVEGRAKPRYDLVVREIGTRAPGASVFASDATVAMPLAAAAERTGADVDVKAYGDARTIPVGELWVVWNEILPPPGPPPTLAFQRNGYAVRDTMSFPAERDSIVAVRLARRESR